MPMRERTRSARITLVLALTLVAISGVAVELTGRSPAASGPRSTEPDGGASPTGPPNLFVPTPNPGAIAQIDDLRRVGRTVDAALLQAMVDTPSSVWFTGGSGDMVERQAREIVAQAGTTVPVLVAYNIPGRDCAQYSAGGAADAIAYRAWIEGFAAGVADHRVLVILEPDGLALLPSDCGQPDTFDREGLIAAAVDIIRTANPNAAVYLDAGHSAWHDPSEMARRLVAAGVRRASGFFLNVSNYQATSDLIRYGRQLSSCIWRFGQAGDCRDASDSATVPATDLMHFVIDTGRNGQGPWTPSATYSDGQAWCNPPGRGLGTRPTLETGDPLVDAYLWVKVPGESDGSCTRGGMPQAPDPEWGVVDPAAGQWFPAQALQLARLANPPLAP